MADDKPIIIIKKKGGHGGHHGGAWKVAYADFVTAMMAFFMVMWLLNSADTATKKNIASYFRRPGIFDTGSGTPLLIGQSGILHDSAPPVGEDKGKKSPAVHDSSQYKKKSGTEDSNQNKRINYKGMQQHEHVPPDITEDTGLKSDKTGEGFPQGDETKMLERIAELLKQKVRSAPEISKLLGVIDIKVEADGLKIEIMDTEKTSMFASGSARIQPEAEEAFLKVAELVKKLDNNIEILGHTDAKPFASSNRGYSNWELSADRANTARRLLEKGGVDSSKIISVVGRAEKEPKNTADPLAASNRRITLKMKFDFSKTVDLSEDPDALDKIPEYQREAQEQNNSSGNLEDKVHSLTPKEILDAQKDNVTITLPDSYEKRDENLSNSKDKIFDKAPVIGPKDLLYGE
jgi:chemotaxis protein MotB